MTMIVFTRPRISALTRRGGLLSRAARRGGGQDPHRSNSAQAPEQLERVARDVLAAGGGQAQEGRQEGPEKGQVRPGRCFCDQPTSARGQHRAHAGSERVLDVRGGAA